MIQTLIDKTVPYVLPFVGAFIATLILTPLVREMNRKLGMVDKPDPRRINKLPIPRGGGLALFLGVFLSAVLFLPAMLWKPSCIAIGIVVLGFADDKMGLSPKVKLLGQILAAFMAWWWADLGFSRLWPSLPVWLDCGMTVFWFVGAINAFNLIDGLDGLASGLAFIATLAMAGSLFIVGHPELTFFHFAFAGGLLGFLCYNYNPASVFLGDSGSMLIGFTLAALPLVTQTPNSFLVSVGVPILAMGVPIFDVALAILRRSLRHLIRKQGTDEVGNDKVMTADIDHLHHRILRAVGLNQRKAAWVLYAITLAAVLFGLGGAVLRSRATGLWLLAVGMGSLVIFNSLSRIEFYDAGRLLNALARDQRTVTRRRWARLVVPVYLMCDVAVLSLLFGMVVVFDDLQPTPRLFVSTLLVRVVVVLIMLILFNVYRTVWSRAMMSNYVRLFSACFLGSLVGGAIIYFAIQANTRTLLHITFSYAILSFVGLAAVRMLRSIVRDIFYALDCTRLKGRKDVSRILVYGAGLRYRSFRRELVRTTSANERMIVGLLDDDILLRGQQIGGVRIEGTLMEAPAIINRLNVDAVVIACVVSKEWMKVIRQTLAPTGVKISLFSFSETPII